MKLNSSNTLQKTPLHFTWTEHTLRFFHATTLIRAATLALLCLTILTGCTTRKATNDPANYLFRTRISDSGLKHFELRDLASRQYHAQEKRRNRSPKSAARQHKKDLKKMHSFAEKIIEENMFCKSGFWVLDFDTDTRGHFLRGECNELASNTDRKAFKDTITNW